MQQGMQQGELNGFEKLVALQLKLRFGPVPDWAQERLVSATEDQLTQWASAILSAKSIDDLFDTDGPSH